MWNDSGLDKLHLVAGQFNQVPIPQGYWLGADRYSVE
jgi:hypothetical protein